MPLGSEKVFVIYAHEDAEAAERIVQALAEAQGELEIDRRELRPGESFVHRRSEGLEQAGYVVLLLSPASVRSCSVGQEWRSALADRQTVLLTLVIADVELPQWLRDLVRIDFTSSFQTGLEQWVRFFTEEQQPPTGAQRASSLSSASRREIRKVVQRCVDRTSFRELLYDLELDEGQLGGESLNEKLVALLHRAELHDKLERFLDYVEEDHGACVESQLKKLRGGSPAGPRSAL